MIGLQRFAACSLGILAAGLLPFGLTILIVPFLPGFDELNSAPLWQTFFASDMTKVFLLFIFTGWIVPPLLVVLVAVWWYRRVERAVRLQRDLVEDDDTLSSARLKTWMEQEFPGGLSRLDGESRYEELPLVDHHRALARAALRGEKIPEPAAQELQPADSRWARFTLYAAAVVAGLLSVTVWLISLGVFLVVLTQREGGLTRAAVGSFYPFWYGLLLALPTALWVRREIARQKWRRALGRGRCLDLEELRLLLREACSSAERARTE